MDTRRDRPDSENGRSPCGERGLKSKSTVQNPYAHCRSPCGERGLKFSVHRFTSFLIPRRSPCGERGLKYRLRIEAAKVNCRSPCGERGLKFILILLNRTCIQSLPMRGAWIEIDVYIPSKQTPRRSPCGERGLKYCCIGSLELAIKKP